MPALLTARPHPVTVLLTMSQGAWSFELEDLLRWLFDCFGLFDRRRHGRDRHQ